MKSVFKYFGGKTNQLDNIMSIMREHVTEFDTVVDVFGGSGKVLLNIPDKWRKKKVYNDINEELYITFKVLQNAEKRALLIEKLSVAFAHERIFKEMKTTHIDDDVETAFKVLYMHTYSYMGDGKSFGRRFKGNASHSRFSIENFVHIKDWTVENKDFKELLRIYNKPRVLLYLDPPYISSGKSYKHSFMLEDLKNLKECIDGHTGTYMMNLSMYDDGMIEIFGSPNNIISYPNPLNKNGQEKWDCGYWWKFRHETMQKTILENYNIPIMEQINS